MDMKTGDLVWFDIPVRDFEAAKAFYGELFGWKFEPMGDPKETEYWFIKTQEGSIGGFRKAEREFKDSESPIMYFVADKLDPAVSRAKKLGAMLVGDRVDIPGDMGCFHLFRDKDRNLIGIWAKS